MFIFNHISEINGFYTKVTNIKASNVSDFYVYLNGEAIDTGKSISDGFAKIDISLSVGDKLEIVSATQFGNLTVERVTANLRNALADAKGKIFDYHVEPGLSRLIPKLREGLFGSLFKYFAPTKIHLESSQIINLIADSTGLNAGPAFYVTENRQPYLSIGPYIFYLIMVYGKYGIYASKDNVTSILGDKVFSSQIYASEDGDFISTLKPIGRCYSLALGDYRPIIYGADVSKKYGDFVCFESKMYTNNYDVSSNALSRSGFTFTFEDVKPFIKIALGDYTEDFLKNRSPWVFDYRVLNELNFPDIAWTYLYNLKDKQYYRAIATIDSGMLNWHDHDGVAKSAAISDPRLKFIVYGNGAVRIPGELNTIITGQQPIWAEVEETVPASPGVFIEAKRRFAVKGLEAAQLSQRFDGRILGKIDHLSSERRIYTHFDLEGDFSFSNPFEKVIERAWFDGGLKIRFNKNRNIRFITLIGTTTKTFAYYNYNLSLVDRVLTLNFPKQDRIKGVFSEHNS